MIPIYRLRTNQRRRADLVGVVPITCRDRISKAPWDGNRKCRHRLEPALDIDTFHTIETLQRCRPIRSV
jgi:hypothetical protein